jgi:alpha-1,3/alpha-1,6-mannosyltransferase
LCAYLRCLFVAFCVLFLWPSFDVILVDQVSVVIPILKLKRSTKVAKYVCVGACVCKFYIFNLSQLVHIFFRLYSIVIFQTCYWLNIQLSSGGCIGNP